MGQELGEMTPERVKDRIKRDIDIERSNLGRNIQQLEDKMRSSVDWRVQFQKKPAAMLGLAFGGGFLFSTLFGRRRCRL